MPILTIKMAKGFLEAVKKMLQENNSKRKKTI